MGSKFGDVSEKGDKSYWVLFDPEKPGSLKEYLVDSCCLEEIRKLKTFDMLLVAIVDANRNKKLKVQTNYSTEIDAAQREYSTSYFSSEFKCYTFPTDEKKRKECETLRKDYGMLAFIEDNLNNPLADVDRAKKYLEDRGFPTIVKALTNKQQGIPLFGAKPSPAATSEETRNIPRGPESNILKTLRYIRAQQAPISLYQEHVDPYAWEIYNAQEILPSAPPMEGGVTIENKTIAEGEKVAEVRSDLKDVISGLNRIMRFPGASSEVTTYYPARESVSTLPVPTAKIGPLPTSSSSTSENTLSLAASNVVKNPSVATVHEFTTVFLHFLQTSKLLTKHVVLLGDVTQRCLKRPYAESDNQLIVPYGAFERPVVFSTDGTVKLDFAKAPTLFSLEAIRQNPKDAEIMGTFGLQPLYISDAILLRGYLSLCSQNASTQGLFIGYMCYRQALMILGGISDTVKHPDIWVTAAKTLSEKGGTLGTWLSNWILIKSTQDVFDKEKFLKKITDWPKPSIIRNWFFLNPNHFKDAGLETLLVYANRFLYYVFNMTKLYVQLLTNDSTFIGQCSYIDIFYSFAGELSKQFIAILTALLDYLHSLADLATTMTIEAKDDMLKLITASHAQTFVMVEQYENALKDSKTSAGYNVEAREYNDDRYKDDDFDHLHGDDCRAYGESLNVELTQETKHAIRCEGE
jgi:hypothetical protein